MLKQTTITLLGASMVVAAIVAPLAENQAVGTSENALELDSEDP